MSPVDARPIWLILSAVCRRLAGRHPAARACGCGLLYLMQGVMAMQCGHFGGGGKAAHVCDDITMAKPQGSLLVTGHSQKSSCICHFSTNATSVLETVNLTLFNLQLPEKQKDCNMKMRLYRNIPHTAATPCPTVTKSIQFNRGNTLFMDFEFDLEKKNSEFCVEYSRKTKDKEQSFKLICGNGSLPYTKSTSTVHRNKEISSNVMPSLSNVPVKSSSFNDSAFTSQPGILAADVSDQHSTYTPVVIGVSAVLGVAFIALIIGLLIYLCRKKARKTNYELAKTNDGNWNHKVIKSTTTDDMAVVPITHGHNQFTKLDNKTKSSSAYQVLPPVGQKSSIYPGLERDEKNPDVCPSVQIREKFDGNKKTAYVELDVSQIPATLKIKIKDKDK